MVEPKRQRYPSYIHGKLACYEGGFVAQIELQTA